MSSLKHEIVKLGSCWYVVEHALYTNIKQAVCNRSPERVWFIPEYIEQYAAHLTKWGAERTLKRRLKYLNRSSCVQEYFKCVQEYFK